MELVMPRTGPLGALVDRIAAAAAAVDRAWAAGALARFEGSLAATVRAEAGRVLPIDAGRLAAACRPDGRPVILHHWATWCEGCLEELPLIVRLARELRGVADVLTVSWDRLQDDDPVELTLARVTDALAGTGLPALVFTGAPEELFDALHLSFHQIPQTRVIDADGGVLRTFEGPLAAGDLAAIAALLDAPSP